MRRPPLSGRVLTITTGPWGTSVIKREENNITIWDGIAFEYFNALAKLGNFSYVVIENNDNNIVDENGQWTGQLGLLKRGEADVAVTPFLMSEQRKKLFYFIEPELWRRETNFDVHDDGSGKVGWLGWFRYTGGVLQPFERGVWLLVALTIVVNFLLLLVVLRLSTRKGKVTNSGVIIVEHFFRLLTLKDTYLEKASVWSSSDWILTSCALFAVAITCFYCRFVGRECFGIFWSKRICLNCNRNCSSFFSPKQSLKPLSNLIFPSQLRTGKHRYPPPLERAVLQSHNDVRGRLFLLRLVPESVHVRIAILYQTNANHWFT